MCRCKFECHLLKTCYLSVRHTTTLVHCYFLLFFFEHKKAAGGTYTLLLSSGCYYSSMEDPNKGTDLLFSFFIEKEARAIYHSYPCREGWRGTADGPQGNFLSTGHRYTKRGTSCVSKQPPRCIGNQRKVVEREVKAT
jgi:hypothetical protein